MGVLGGFVWSLAPEHWSWLGLLGLAGLAGLLRRSDPTLCRSDDGTRWTT
jgi:hypothetical protein